MEFVSWNSKPKLKNIQNNTYHVCTINNLMHFEDDEYDQIRKFPKYFDLFSVWKSEFTSAGEECQFMEIVKPR